MKTIVLPGYSPNNKAWADEAASKISDSHPHYWQHWSNGSFSPKREVEKILKEVGESQVNILAKSVGTSITNEIIANIPGQINKIILCGIPSTNKERYKNFANFDGKRIICFQNEKDPWATYEEIKEFLGKINPQIKVVKKDRSDHHYPYYEDFRKFLLE